MKGHYGKNVLGADRAPSGTDAAQSARIGGPRGRTWSDCHASALADVAGVALHPSRTWSKWPVTTTGLLLLLCFFFFQSTLVSGVRDKPVAPDPTTKS